MKKLLVLVFVLSSVVIAQAQVQVALGLKAGVNVSKLNTDEVESSSITAFHGGAFALFKFTVIGIQPELLFSQQGTSIDDVDFGEGGFKNELHDCSGNDQVLFSRWFQSSGRPSIWFSKLS
jgi:hypothetical protein